MLFIDDYEQYSYTQIIVPITLQESPSDYDELSYYLDVNEDDFRQENCYIGKQRIEEMRIYRVENADCEYSAHPEPGIRCLRATIPVVQSQYSGL